MGDTLNTSPPTFYTVDDIQGLLGIGRNSAYKLVNKKDFPSISVGNRIVIPIDHFNDWINKKATRHSKEVM